jgi:hypothetical protein
MDYQGAQEEVSRVLSDHTSQNDFFKDRNDTILLIFDAKMIESVETIVELCPKKIEGADTPVTSSLVRQVAPRLILTSWRCF